MWWDPQRPSTFSEIRHDAENGHGLKTYGWTRHDGETFGKQTLQDQDVELEMSWAKQSEGGREGGYGGDFAVRMRAGEARTTAGGEGEEEESAKNGKRVCVIFYVVDERLALGGLGTEGREAGETTFSINENQRDGGVDDGEVVRLASGFRGEDVKGWALHMPKGPGQQHVEWSYLGENVRHTHNLTSVAQLRLYETYQKAGGGMPVFGNKIHAEKSNLAMFQFLVPLDHTLDLVFNSGLEPLVGEPRGSRGTKNRKGATPEGIVPKVRELSGDKLTELLRRREDAFDDKFAAIFPIEDKGAGEVAKRALSNLLGSIGYFAGTILISTAARRGARVTERYPTRALFTAVPSRSFFPRGFLWDEGFHQLVIQKWSSGLSREMIASWFDLMNVDGWIPREAILGQEALKRVPAEFVVQNPSHANPPSMLISLHRMAVAAKRGEGAGEEEKEFLEGIYEHLKVWFDWFTRTQKGPVPHSYRWRGRDPTTDRELNPKTLTSGLDDYPRATHPTDTERHLDLRCWMALGARTMSEIAEIVGAPRADVESYEILASSLEDQSVLDDLHYDEGLGMYFDWGYHTDKVKLVRAIDANGNQVLHREVGNQPPSEQLVKEFGYVSLFPFMMKLIDPRSKILGDHLRYLRDESLLWTPHGLRSLATTSKYYNKYNTEHDKPYWRSPIWINVNYLVLNALQHYAREEGPHRLEARRLFHELRKNLIRNIVGQYNKTGFLWENYNDSSGNGMGSHPFTGWTSLFILIASDTDD
ncbi:mannosyl-oligosaccharide glucosidase GCS1-like [Chloropicon primus]|uniref:Mannosyl-oligosaccharide glucosidase n=1 Tax=Chloropicon primus TaxID=1764295 RepID=A0A5B8MEC0_9CHLO|nr:glycoside hydrolase [Chloropicon primus]UPQ97723.1 mannosyl-oligosaccharide glucosidase GCS1-like [Chloropicon primus]|eukprot:QDZ18514.1 glycoside hydrolase [Chloropicon primus]